MEEILIKYHADIPHIEKTEIGDWIDLRAAHDVTIQQGEAMMISLGVAMKLPEGYEAHVAPRSSTFKNYGLIETNSFGIIDNSYSGTNDIWKFPVYCLVGRQEKVEPRFTKGILKYLPFKKKTYYSEVKKGDRICQFRIVPRQPEVSSRIVDELDETDRGGFGSSGVK